MCVAQDGPARTSGGQGLGVRGSALSPKIHLRGTRRHCAFQAECMGHFRVEGTAAFGAVRVWLLGPALRGRCVAFL